MIWIYICSSTLGPAHDLWTLALNAAWEHSEHAGPSFPTSHQQLAAMCSGGAADARDVVQGIDEAV